MVRRMLWKDSYRRVPAISSRWIRAGRYVSPGVAREAGFLLFSGGSSLLGEPAGPVAHACGPIGSGTAPGVDLGELGLGQLGDDVAATERHLAAVAIEGDPVAFHNLPAGDRGILAMLADP